MLCQFTFCNFKSYKNETVFDFQAEPLPEFSDTLLGEDKGGKLLPVSVVYGPNGGGKSNLLRALSCLISTVTKPIRQLNKNREPFIVQQEDKSEPFLLDDESRNLPTDFEIYFRQGTNEYRYLLSIKEDEIEAESLYWRAIGGKKTGTLFTRERSEIVLGPSIRKRGISRSVNPKMPYLSFLAINYNLPMIAEVQSWFEACIIRNYANPKTEWELWVSEDEAIKKFALRALNDIGIDLTDYRYDRENRHLYTRRTIHNKVFELDYLEESAGTQKLIAILPVLLIALKEGRLVVFDELDAKLHPKLLRYVVSLFKDTMLNQHGAQLLFSSQDMTTLKNTVFRRDEIWFAAENEAHESEIYSLYDIRREDNEHVNNTAAYDKQYLEGRYGADPYLTNMLAGGGWE